MTTCLRRHSAPGSCRKVELFVSGGIAHAKEEAATHLKNAECSDNTVQRQIVCG